MNEEKTKLKTRTLWYDGTVEVDSDAVPSLFMRGINPSQILVSNPSADIELFNQLSDDPISTSKNGLEELDFSWQIPPEYEKLDLTEYFVDKLVDRNLPEEYAIRLEKELVEIKVRKLENFFKCLIYAITELDSAGVVRGVGRGSACASLALYLMGVHLVDPIKFDIPLVEFYHD